MRIGFFTDTYTPQINGVVTSIRLFKRELEALGHEVYVFAPEPVQPDDAETTVRFPSIPFVFQREMRFASPISLDALKVLDSVEFDIIHSHDPFSIGLFGLSVARRHKIPYVNTYHALYPEYVHYVWETRLTKKAAEWMSKEFSEVCTSIVAPSTKVERYLRSWGVTVPIEIIPTGVDVDTYGAPDPARVTRLKNTLQLSQDERVVLFVGRLGREKNVELLLRAMWHARTPRIRLLIAGDGPHRPELESLREELGLTNRVDFLGYLDRADVVAAYHIADAFTFASTTETQGLVVGEAMASGLPVICVHDDALEDFVVDGRTGLVAETRPEAIAQAIDTLMADPRSLAEMGAAGRERALSLSIAREAKRLEAHYERAIAAPAPKRKLPRLALPRHAR